MALAIEMRNITKRFPGVIANKDVNLKIKAGEIHALLGENGAGKSTLMNVLYGLYEPEEGEILVDGKIVRIKDPKTAINHGIGMVHQHFMLVKPFTVIENIMLGAEIANNGVLDFKKARAEILKISKKYGLEVKPDAKVEEISVGMQQRVEILKALYRGADVLILDEPTAVLTPNEIQDLIKIMRSLTKQGKSIVFITHKLKEIKEACDKVTVIRRGQVIGTLNTADATIDVLAEMMVGRKVILKVEKNESKIGENYLEIKDLNVKDSRNLPAVKGVSFTVRAGEIVGIAGVDGNGQTELIEALTGLSKVESGSIKLKGNEISKMTIRKRYEQGLAHIPEDRHKHGLVLDFNLAENMVLQNFYQKPFSRGEILNYNEINEYAERLIKEYDIRTPSISVEAKKLSGGNQQKVIIAREIERNPHVIIAAQPTRGLDVGAIEFVHRRLVEQRDAGDAVLLISLELDEVLSLSDRILVMYEGNIVGELTAEEANEQKVGVLMAGGKVSSKVVVSNEEN
ncbi:ABC transporter ATP-binding protein [Clostridium sp. 'deep sea']|uniref:ABC transporter ATP-binding protein n=1 Tax=Clostridium sp. 'deep sea' TaxID=2779445 RepID=UPI0018969B92|nr:ABC transporter ATP-binding protein [Clostridium sp. 'deep sea']QOR35655.1 ABC transporter ATP-binding protein [Clostridium sp. 'deep sea']